MGSNLMILLHVDGTWDTHGSFTSKYNTVIEVLEKTSFQSFLDLLKSVIRIDWSQNIVRLSYIVAGSPPPIVVSDDSELLFYLKLKSFQNDTSHLPLCVEFVLDSTVHPQSNDATTHNDHNFHNEAYVNSVCNANLQSNTYSTPQRSGSGILADILLHRYVDATKKPYPPNDLREDMIREYGVSMSYRKALLVKQKALTKLYGSDEDSYQLLPSMCYMLEQKNPDKVFPNVEHGHCTEHIVRNIRGKFKGPKEDLAWKFRKSCRAATEFEREEYLQMLDEQDSRIRSYLWDIGESKWSRCKSGPFRYSIMTSNAAESMNNVSNSAREYPVSKLVDFIRERMQKWFHERHERALSTTTILTQNLESELITLQRDAFKMKLLRLALVCHVMISSHRTTDGNH
ncbi:unnamed protein product [Cuscuta campestris]|uniref:Uncharacterized protein n=1 Tax=Cuscuta campestris TaxID=132261 RepID=A0A484K421_9ASTE|nr:unnamed protein product [Cuscuta campestris]